MTADTFYSLKAGQWHNAAPADLSDRGLHYGDGLFETIRFAADGSIPLLNYHLQRLQQGFTALGFDADLPTNIKAALNDMPQQTSAAKLLITRGPSPRGYLPPLTPDYFIQLQCFTAPAYAAERHTQGIKCSVSPVQLARQPALAGFKHLNRLEQVLIRQKFPGDCQEVVVTDTDGFVIEGCMSNLFFSEQGQWLTPSLNKSGVNGVVRRWLLDNHSVQEIANISLQRLFNAEAVFMSNTLNGICMVQTIDGHQYHQLSGIIEMQQEFQELFA